MITLFVSWCSSSCLPGRRGCPWGGWRSRRWRSRTGALHQRGPSRVGRTFPVYCHRRYVSWRISSGVGVQLLFVCLFILFFFCRLLLFWILSLFSILSLACCCQIVFSLLSLRSNIANTLFAVVACILLIWTCFVFFFLYFIDTAKLCLGIITVSMCSLMVIVLDLHSLFCRMHSWHRLSTPCLFSFPAHNAQTLPHTCSWAPGRHWQWP